MDPRKFDKIFNQEYDFVWRVVRRLGVSAESVDDVVQDVFLVLHRRRNELEIRESCRALLYGIARRVAGHQRRAAQHRATQLRVVANSAPDETRDDPERRALLQERAAVVRHALEAMDDDKRTMFELTQIEGMSVAEAAELLGVNVNTAYTRARTARALVGKAIARHRAQEGRVRVHAQR